MLLKFLDNTLNQDEKILLNLERIYSFRNHHLYFERLAPYKKTITEFAFIPEHIHDGQYFMKIEIPPMQLDAAPSRPFLFNFMEN